MKISTRTATLNDHEILLEFEQGVINFERAFDPTLKDEKIHYYDLKAMILADDAEVAVALINDEIVGSGYAKIEIPKSYLKHDRFAYLGFMFVKPEHRGKGINKKIVEHLNHWIRSRNISEVRLDVYSDNPGAIKAYEKAGFKKHLINMRMDLNKQ